jgi:hypothetical protein
VQMAERGQLLDLKCEMPHCYHRKGRAAFDPVAKTRTKWAPSPDHYPTLKSAGGHLVPENVRLSHTECNQRDYTRRKQIGALSSRPTVRTDGRPRWCARPTCPRSAVERPPLRADPSMRRPGRVMGPRRQGETLRPQPDMN